MALRQLRIRLSTLRGYVWPQTEKHLSKPKRAAKDWSVSHAFCLFDGKLVEPLLYLDMSDYNRRSIVPIREMSVSEYLDLLCLERETPLRTVLQEEERAAIKAHGLTLNSFDQSQLNSL